MYQWEFIVFLMIYFAAPNLQLMLHGILLKTICRIDSTFRERLRKPVENVVIVNRLSLLES